MIATQDTYQQYVGTGATGSQYALPFKFLSAEHIRVLVDNIAYVGNHSVIGAGEESGGYVIIDAAIPATSTVRVERLTPILQPYAYEEGDKLSADTTEENHDHTILAMQDLHRTLEEYALLVAQLNQRVSTLEAYFSGSGAQSDAIISETGMPILDEAELLILEEAPI